MIQGERFNYKYIPRPDNGNQYKDKNGIVPHEANAIYVKSVVSEYNGNPLIEALPAPRSDVQTYIDYSHEIPMHTREEFDSLSDSDKRNLISEQKLFRFPLPFQHTLEDEVWVSLQRSYHRRYLINIGTDDQTEYIADCNEGDGVDSGFALIGYSGCGKTTSLLTLFSNYPQVIHHHINALTSFTQITYLIVTCPENSNFAALYASIGHAVDKALGLQKQRIYETYISRGRNLGIKMLRVCDVISKFGIGIIAFDEIQQINFIGTKENTVEGLLTIVNRTKTAFAFIGTEDALDKMFPNLRTARRAGKTFIASEYCENYDYFTMMTQRLFRYQLFPHHVELTEPLLRTLYKYTKGIISQVVDVFMALENCALDDQPNEIDADYIKKVIDEEFVGTEGRLLLMKDPIAREKEKIRLMDSPSLTDQQLLEQDLEQRRNMEKIKEEYELEEKDSKTRVIERIVDAITDLTDEYTVDQISKMSLVVMGRAENREITEKQLRKQVYKALRESSAPAVQMVVAPNSQTVQNPKENQTEKSKLSKGHKMMLDLVEQDS